MVIDQYGSDRGRRPFQQKNYRGLSRLYLKTTKKGSSGRSKNLSRMSLGIGAKAGHADESLCLAK